MEYWGKSFSYLPLEGPVKLKDPAITLCYIEYYGLNPNNIPEKPYDHFFGKWVSNMIKHQPFLQAVISFHYRLRMVSES